MKPNEVLSVEELEIWTRFACAVCGDHLSAEDSGVEADKMLEQWRRRAARTVLANPDVSVLEYYRSHLNRVPK